MAAGISFQEKLIAWGRIVALLATLAWYLSGLIFRTLLLGHSETRGFRYRRKYTGVSLRILGVKLTKLGHPFDQPALYVSNHRSLLDPFIELHDIDAHIVSKAEVARYPLVGRGARETGVVFLRRDSSESRAATREAIRDLLCAGKSVLLYPEGTTSNAETVQDFKPGAFQIAAEIGVPVVPVAIQYGDASDHWADGPMLPFFLRKFGKRNIFAYFSIGEPVTETDSLRLLDHVRTWISIEILRGAQMLAEQQS